MPVSLPLLITLGLLSALTPFAIDMYLPSIPAIAQDLHAPVALAQLSVTVYLGVFAAAQLVLGPLSDVLGRRLPVAVGLAVFALAAVACALAPSMTAMLWARAVQALGGAAVAVTIPALVRDLFDRDDYARVMGLVMLVMGLAPLLAPSVGGLILLYGTWHWVFVGLLGITAVAAVLFLRLLPETLPPERRHPPAPARVLGNYWALLRHRAALGYLLTGMASFGGMMVFIVNSPFVYIELHEVPAGWFGPLFGLNIAAAMLFSALNARWVPRWGAERLLRFGLTVQAGAALMLLLIALLPALLAVVAPLWLIALGALAYIAMAGLVMGNAMAGFMAFFPRMAGTASAFAGAGRFGFGALTGSVTSLLHDGTALPLLLGMACCGLLAAATYQLICCAEVPADAHHRPGVPPVGGEGTPLSK
ncbi:MAG: Bcr/CflA family multidrug efflux MFS transporter [Thiohalocapsa sp.]|jgi:DHA1 family bicyclomycin/chloramphenicol resistance-like MFS transporter|uniref:Bcr/CflA family multidrug efflux MFS transporter n=1 Tax=Thiohalocapsa sp. TaxID=2497641 RepID=UPI0025FD4475|nr:Bcr/CflA family multidrug efflux MFS transporter [Thiohalocapsa sp.]MCG6941589.1 Bcr/CflA family multidrug efflux MFS transporter [Thiohalocapsa sp.]